MKHLVLTPDRNTQGSDYNGAFKPEAERYARFYTGQGDTTITFLGGSGNAAIPQGWDSRGTVSDYA